MTKPQLITIIIPIFLYICWSYHSIKYMFSDEPYDENKDSSSVMWGIITTIAILVTIVFSAVSYIFRAWGL